MMFCMRFKACIAIKVLILVLQDKGETNIPMDKKTVLHIKN